MKIVKDLILKQSPQILLKIHLKDMKCSIKKNSNRKNKEKFEFEIIVENKPQKLVIYKCDDINCKVKEFCNLYKLSFDDKKLILHKINDHLNGVRIQ